MRGIYTVFLLKDTCSYAQQNRVGIVYLYKYVEEYSHGTKFVCFPLATGER